MAKSVISMQEQMETIVEAAKNSGAETSTYYLTTLDRYNTQIGIMEKLKKIIESEGSVVEKEYVKGRKNIVINPAITEYNKTATAANNTVQTLMKIVSQFHTQNISIVEGDADEL